MYIETLIICWKNSTLSVLVWQFHEVSIEIVCENQRKFSNILQSITNYPSGASVKDTKLL